ncbi:MAG: hypothetical protein H0A76_13165 [Candidatus Thiodubiliella endoseptemdiera]|uniref:Uncharacterized protein n=1 Tax=Candidatus Thiodubiliella endoseptemdiera TaxID=2738886 RepID=A0A853FAS2_9GAMM|nr:hypothetical protein [Candidatus Thiodubiliella endoseptemdiera]
MHLNSLIPFSLKLDGDKKITVTDEHKISRDQKHSRVVTKTESKDYKIVFDKRIITADLNTIPYGY